MAELPNLIEEKLEISEGEPKMEVSFSNGTDSWGPTFCVITGASRGIGQAIAVEISKKFGKGSVLVLIARYRETLQETEKLVAEVCPEHICHQVIFPEDLSNPESSNYDQIIKSALQEHKPPDFKQAIIVHNAYGLNKRRALDIEEDYVNAELKLNFSSMALLNNMFFKVFTTEDVPFRTIVHITSGTAVFVTPETSMYSCIKAARNHFFKILAAEEPTIRVLNYDPGVVNTEILKIGSPLLTTHPEKAKKLFESLGMPLLEPVDTAKVLMEYLESNFKSGSIVNAYKNPTLYETAVPLFNQYIGSIAK